MKSSSLSGLSFQGGELTAIVFASIFSLLSIAHAETAPSPGTATPRPKSIQLKVGYIPIAECAHLYVGISKKFFEAEGLDIELQPMNGGAVILPAVQQGSLDIGFTNMVTIMLLNSKIPPGDKDSFASLAGATYERAGHSNHALLIKKGSTVTVNAIASGKAKVAVNTSRNIEELMLRQFLLKRGLKDDSLVTVPMGFPNMVSALENGDVDAIGAVEPFIEPTLRSGKTTLLARHYLEVAPDSVVATYGVTRKWLQENPDKAARFVRAFNKADDFIKTNDAETRQIIGSYTRINKADLPIIGLPAFESTVKKESIRDLNREMKKLGFITRDISADDIVMKMGK